MYENFEQLANLKIGKVSERISRENSERLGAVIRDHAQRGLSQSGLLEAAKVRSQLRTARQLCQEVYRIWLEIILTVDKALTEQSVAFITAKVLDTSISQASNIRQNLNKSLSPEATAELAGQVDREMTAIVGSVRRDLEILRREQELASPKTTPEAPHERQSRLRAIWGHVERIVGWDGLSFAVLFPLAVGLLAMDEFSKARLAFDASAGALAIKLVLSSRKHLTSFWKIGGSVAGLGLAITLLLATNSWVSQRQTVAASRSTRTPSQTLTPLEKPSQGTEKSTSLDSAPVASRYKPSDPSLQVDMNVFVTKTDLGEQYRLDVSFAVPPAHLQYDSISIYGYRIYGPDKKMRENAPASTFPSLKGNWEPAEHVTFKVDVPKQFGDPAAGWEVRFCVGDARTCFPSPNLLEGHPIADQ